MKAILKNGVICPKEPVPSDWHDGTELDVQKSADDSATIEAEFRQLEAQWDAETRFHSNPRIIMGHPAMRAIVAMGNAVVPIILRDLQQKPSLMVWALPEITGENLAPPKIDGGFAKYDITKQIEEWLTWGRAKGVL